MSQSFNHINRAFRTQYNGCKSYGCSNCGVSDLSHYSLSERLGYPAYHCPLCGAYPPVLLNAPIIALNHQITSMYFTQPAWLNLNCDCSEPSLMTRWTKYGKTKAGSARFKCHQCGAVRSAVNRHKIQHALQPWFERLCRGESPSQLQRNLKLNSKLFYSRLIQLAELLEAVNHQYEQRWLTNNHNLTLQVHSHTLECRSGLTGKNNKQKQTHLWTLSSFESHTGYQLLFSTNFLSQKSLLQMPEAIEGQYNQLSSIYRNSQDNEEQLCGDSMLQRAELTYRNTLARKQFDQLAYTSSEHAVSSEGILLRPVYAAHSHFQHLKFQLNKQPHISLLLEHESFLRGAAIFAFNTHPTANTQANLFYLHHKRHKPIINNQEKVLKFNDYNNNNQKHNEKDINIKNLNNPSSFNTEQKYQEKSLSWWQEKWLEFEYQYDNQTWSIGIGNLTPKANISTKSIQSLITTKPNWQQEFWGEFEVWLPIKQRNKISVKYLHYWLMIFRFIYNRQKALAQCSNTIPYQAENITKLLDSLEIK